jgi:hypothetical protein
LIPTQTLNPYTWLYDHSFLRCILDNDDLNNNQNQSSFDSDWQQFDSSYADYSLKIN